MADKFTDNMLTQFQLSMLKDYQRLNAEGKSIEEISKFIRDKFEFNLIYNNESSLWRLPEGEWQKARTVLDTFLAAVLPKEEALPPQWLFPPIMFTVIQLNEFRERRDDYYYCSLADSIFYWSLLDSLTYDHHLHHLHDAAASVGTNDNGYGDSLNNVSDKDKANLWAFLLLLLISTVAIVLTFIAIAYLFVEFFETMERLWHNEGLWQAMISMLSAIAFGTASGWLTALFLATPITALAVAAGVNPVGMVILGVICLTFIGAGAGCFITNSLQNYLVKIRNPEALDPQDPHRFTLTKAEEENLIAQNLDPIKVKCAIAALRQKLGKNELPYYITRLFNSDKQEIIEQVRELRRGKLSAIEIEIGGTKLNFDLRPLSEMQHQASNHNDYYPADEEELSVETSQHVHVSHRQDFYPQDPQRYQQQPNDEPQFYPHQQTPSQMPAYHEGYPPPYTPPSRVYPPPYIPQGSYPLYQPQQPAYIPNPPSIPGSGL
ncbi:hypothetical protein Lnau_2625 [Legionella nautarum]|uniref:Uncharacterized protein n=1 Tax=Legionella nautarum TaxID=45070 RepID=A0A0W0WKZ5_9GAMM|nr:hypothetical protein [Legionella nautarum]KTD32977.1 hypothetical protein Lnau_2625 [Legionella nautarum]